MNPIELVGGPMDGKKLPNPDYFHEGEIVEMKYTHFGTPGTQHLSGACVYVVSADKLVFDPERTRRRAEIVKKEGPQA